MNKKSICFLFIFLTTSVIAAPKLQKLTVALDWFVNPDHAPLFVAKQQGYYKKKGLDVIFIPPADPSDPPKWAATGKVDVAIDYQPHYLLERANGLPLVQVGTLINQPLNCLVVLKSSGISSIKQLKNKTIGYSIGDVTSAILDTMLRHNELSLKNVKLVNVHYALSQALLAGKIDAVTDMMRNFELIQLQLMGHPAQAFYPEKNGVPPYSELILVTNKKLANNKRIRAFLSALQQGVKYLKQHPQTTWKEFAKDHPELNNTLNHKEKSTSTNPMLVHRAQFPLC